MSTGGDKDPIKMFLLLFKHNSKFFNGRKIEINPRHSGKILFYLLRSRFGHYLPGNAKCLVLLCSALENLPPNLQLDTLKSPLPLMKHSVLTEFFCCINKSCVALFLNINKL